MEEEEKEIYIVINKKERGEGDSGLEGRADSAMKGHH